MSDSDSEYISDCTPDPDADPGDLGHLGLMLGSRATTTCLAQRTISCMQIEQRDDIRELEDKIRQTLKCDSATCMALDGTAYTQFRLKALRRLRGAVVGGESRVHITSSILLIADLDTLEVSLVERPSNMQMYPRPKREKGVRKTKKKHS